MEMLTRLIGTPSVSSVNPDLDQGNRAIIDLLANWLDGLGFRVEIQPLSAQPDKANLVATLGPGAGGLVLAGHVDTVPYDTERWRQDPFRLTEADGRLYGLGTCDMKSFLALAIEAARTLDPGMLKHPLTIVATADEESAMHGAEALVAAGTVLGRYAIIGEPTGLAPVRMHKGILMEAIRVHGRSGHSSDPTLGLSALDGMYQVMGAVLAWRQRLQAGHRMDAFRVPVPTLNLGRIHGGDNPNRICAECELQIDLRPLPGMGVEDLRAELRAVVEQALAGGGLSFDVAPLFPGIAAFETAASSAVVRIAEQLTGQVAGAVSFGTEAPYFQRLGMESLILGPGDIDQAHQPNEYLALERIPATLDLLDGFIRRFCLEETT
jgi:acetylornithine deacetylase